MKKHLVLAGTPLLALVMAISTAHANPSAGVADDINQSVDSHAMATGGDSGSADGGSGYGEGWGGSVYGGSTNGTLDDNDDDNDFFGGNGGGGTGGGASGTGMGGAGGSTGRGGDAWPDDSRAGHRLSSSR